MMRVPWNINLCVANVAAAVRVPQSGLHPIPPRDWWGQGGALYRREGN